jgi:hypothetical protein
MSEKRRRPSKVIWPVLIWDTVWKLLAIRRAVQLKKYRWIPVLAAASTGGLVPIVFLLKNREAARPEPEIP